MAIFLTGATGFLGSYITAELLANHSDRLALLVRAPSLALARRRLWQVLQLHMDFYRFSHYLQRMDIYLGDITRTQLGLSTPRWQRLAHTTTSVIHAAAVLNRKSHQRCFDVNLLGTRTVIQLARAAHEHHGLRRFSAVSTVSVSAPQHGAQVTEDEAFRPGHFHRDPYARSKQLAEEQIRRLLPDVPLTIFRPSAVLGESHHPRTIQFDTARAVVLLAHTAVIPLRADWRVDIVPAVDSCRYCNGRSRRS
jgi:thioester reductase-like protein